VKSLRTALRRVLMFILTFIVLFMILGAAAGFARIGEVEIVLVALISVLVTIALERYSRSKRRDKPSA
jgi:membrane protein implicated in regulation of membrane protease activity